MNQTQATQPNKVWNHPLATIKDGKEFTDKFWDYLAVDRGMAMNLSFHETLKFALGAILKKRGAMARGDMPKSKKVDAILLMGDGGWGKSEIIEELPIFINRYNSNYYCGDATVFEKVLAYSNAIAAWNNLLVDGRIRLYNERKALGITADLTQEEELALFKKTRSYLSARELEAIEWWDALDKAVQDEYLDHLTYRICRAHTTNVSTSTNDITFKGGVKMDALLRDTNRKLEYAIESSMLMHTVAALEEMLQGAAALPSLKDPLTRGKYLPGDGTERDIKLELLIGMSNTNIDKLMANNDMRAFLNRFDFAIICAPESPAAHKADLLKVLNKIYTHMDSNNMADKFTAAAKNLIQMSINNNAQDTLKSKTGMLYAPRNIIADINYLRELIVQSSDDFESVVMESGVLQLINSLETITSNEVLKISEIISKITAKGSSKNTARQANLEELAKVYQDSNVLSNICRYNPKFAQELTSEITTTIKNSANKSIFSNINTFAELRNSVDSAINSKDPTRIEALYARLEAVKAEMVKHTEWAIPYKDLSGFVSKIQSAMQLNDLGDTDI